MSWESSLEYYRIINETVQARLGGFHSAQCVMVSVDFAEIEVWQRQERWAEATQAMLQAARRVERGGADFVILCTNTMHKSADEIQAGISIPFLHIADLTAEQVKARGMNKIGLLGTRFTMEDDFYKGRLMRQHGLDVSVPAETEREIIHRVIYDELCLGQIKADSKEQYTRIIARLAEQGAQGIILGCTEIGLLVKAEDSPVPLFDTTLIHATAAVEYALAE